MKKDQIIAKLLEHDNRFQKIDGKLNKHGAKLVEHGEQLKEVQDKVSEIKDIADKILKTVDNNSGALKRLDVERLATHHRLKKLEKVVFKD